MYSPKISEKMIPELYRLKLRTRKPMTHLVNEAIAEYLNKSKAEFEVIIQRDQATNNIHILERNIK